MEFWIDFFIKFMEEVQKKDFNVNDFNHVVEAFTMEKFKGPAKSISTEMNEIQKQLFKYAEVLENYWVLYREINGFFLKEFDKIDWAVDKTEVEATLVQ